MPPKSPIEHAKHNEQVCNYLSGKANFCDWIVTTAFYSALHYVRHLMLPYTDSKGVTYTNFEHLYSATNCNNENKHAFVKKFVRNNHKLISVQYNQLYDLSHSARYVSYQIPRKTANEAKDLLAIIKKHVTDSKAKKACN